MARASAVQLADAGANMYVPSPTGHALGASDAKYTSLECRAMTKRDIAQTVTDFAAAVRAKKAGCDGVQLHGAHSYLAFAVPLALLQQEDR